MERVVYLLGAGFSAPFGIPLMSNFLEKSKDMYSEDRDSFKHFEKIFEAIDKIAKSAIYYSTDVFNIEEILSILEIDEQLENKGLRKSFEKYVKDVIQYYTPKLKSYQKSLSVAPEWYNYLFGDPILNLNKLWGEFGFFVANIYNLIFRREEPDPIPKGRKIRCSVEPTPGTQYSIITLNYDLILECVCDFINENYSSDKNVNFADEIIIGTQQANLNPYKPILAKLHGSIDTTIVPPTWNKAKINKGILDSWRLAHKALVNANHIRIIGYSLPITDTYIRYLLKSAAVDVFNLKTIDVICLDPNGTIKKKYEEFIRFGEYGRLRFANAKVEQYLAENRRICTPQETIDEMKMNKLELAHDIFFSKIDPETSEYVNRAYGA